MTDIIDFNDLHVVQGLEAVELCIANAFVPEDKNEGRLKLYHWSELEFLPKREPLIKRVLDCNAMSALYGESNAGKTFFALCMALDIARGESWQDCRTKQGSVVYVATESGIGIVERLVAFQRHHDVDNAAPFYLIPTSIDLCNGNSDTQELIEKVNALENVEMVVIDTLSRALSGGNENSPEDMGAFIGNCDKIREATGAHTLIIHHSGKDQARGLRGHSSLKAAVDTEIELKQSKDRIIVAEIKKQRDGKTGTQFFFKLEEVPIGQDQDGEEITSCVLIPTDEKPKEKRKLTGVAQKSYELLPELMGDKGKVRPMGRGLKGKKGPKLISVTYDEFKEAYTKARISNTDKQDTIRKTINERVIPLLEDAEYIDFHGGNIFLVDKPDKPGQT